MTDKIILYSYYRSSCSWRVRIALALKGLEYEYKSMLNEDEEDYKKVNPMGQVPALIINGKIFLQSVSILEFMDEVYPQVPLFPQNVYEKAKVREIVEMINSGIQPMSNMSTAEEHSKDETEQIKWIQFYINKGFGAVESILKDCAGTYCVGDDLTMADIFLVPQVANAHRFNVDMSQFPIISRIDSTLSKLEAFKKAHFTNQPDCPPDLKIVH